MPAILARFAADTASVEHVYDVPWGTAQRDALAALGKDPARLKAVLSYHLLPTKVLAADIKTGAAKTVNGANLGLGRAGTFVTVDSAIVQTADISAANGVIHTVDQVLIPPVRR